MMMMTMIVLTVREKRRYFAYHTMPDYKIRSSYVACQPLCLFAVVALLLSSLGMLLDTHIFGAHTNSAQLFLCLFLLSTFTPLLPIRKFRIRVTFCKNKSDKCKSLRYLFCLHKLDLCRSFFFLRLFHSLQMQRNHCHQHHRIYNFGSISMSITQKHVQRNCLKYKNRS